MLGEKARWEHPKKVAVLILSCKKHSTKTAVIRPLTTHLTNHPNITRKTHWALLENEEQTHKQCSPFESYIWTHQCWPTSKNLHSLALCKHWLLSKGFTKCYGWKKDDERESKEFILLALLDYVDDEIIKKKIGVLSITV